MQVPSGQRVAQAIPLPVPAGAELADLVSSHLDKPTPLRFYVLRAAPRWRRATTSVPSAVVRG
jgi:hypothetical protein